MVGNKKLFAVLLTAALASESHGQKGLEELSLEELTKLEVTTVARKPQSLADVPAAAFVISADDIARSGARTLPDVLRMAPGIQVAQLDNGRYAVTARGFIERTARRLQVLIDGRSIYNPFFSGTIWEEDFIALEDIERIEVIRGPGAAMWGFNAVNGVINIVSKHSRSQNGGEAALGLGDNGLASLYARYNQRIDDANSWRLSLQGRHGDPSHTASDSQRKPNDGFDNALLDFRFDHDESNRNLTLWSTVSRSNIDDVWRMYPQLFSRTPIGWNMAELPVHQAINFETLTGRYRWLDDHGVERTLRLSATHTDMLADNRRLGAMFDVKMMTYDLDYQGRHAIGSHDLLWGLGHRTNSDEMQAIEPFLSWRKKQDTQRTTGAFLQDDWTLIPDRLHLGLGARLDHAHRTGDSTSPNLSLTWTPSYRDSLWAKYAQAPRLPARAEYDPVVTGFATPTASPLGPLFMRMLPSQNPVPEKLEGYEIGYRKQFGNTLNIDLAAYSYRYKDMFIHSSASAPYLNTDYSYPFLASNFTNGNKLSGAVNGVELGADWLVKPNWRLQLSYSWMWLNMDTSNDPVIAARSKMLEQGEPRHYGSLRSQWNLSKDQLLDAWIRASAGYERVHAPDTTASHIPGYVTLDLRYARKISRDIELAVSGRNLTGGRRVEFISDFLPGQTVEIAPTVFISLRYRH